MTSPQREGDPARWSFARPRRDWTVTVALRTARVRRVYRFLRAELRDGVPIGLRRRARALRSGFTSASWMLYGLDTAEVRDYLPDFVDSDCHHEHPLADTLNNKLVFSRVMRALGMPSPRVLAYIRRGALHHPETGEPRTDIAGGLAALLAQHGRLVLKPARGGAGRGVNIVSGGDGRHALNGAPVSFERITAIVADLDRYLVLELVEQAAYAAQMFPHTTNTLRILTLWDVEQDRPFVAAAAHRIGTRATIPIDNFHAGRGGICAPIDVDTGTLGAAMTLDASGLRTRLEQHPDTGAQITGIRVPGWPATVARVLDLAGRLPEALLVGWDIVPTEQGPVFLEANIPPGTAVWQVHRPLLADARVRRFYEHMGWIRRAPHADPRRPGWA
jgi:hypothetical protein